MELLYKNHGIFFIKKFYDDQKISIVLKILKINYHQFG